MYAYYEEFQLHLNMTMTNIDLMNGEAFKSWNIS
jgi:hypothetical protein